MNLIGRKHGIMQHHPPKSYKGNVLAVDTFPFTFPLISQIINSSVWYYLLQPYSASHEVYPCK